MPRKLFRLVAVFAVVFIFLMYRMLQSSWDAQQPAPAGVGRPLPEPPVAKVTDAAKEQVQLNGKTEDKSASSIESQKASDGQSAGVKKPTSQLSTGDGKASQGVAKKGGSSDIPSVAKPAGGAKAGNKGPPTKHIPDELEFEAERGTPIDQVMVGDKLSPVKPKKVHWSKSKERFPVPKESLIPLPTGTPKKIPKIQHAFSAETEASRSKRLQRLSMVKDEIQRSWDGYKKYAWMHDELSPVTNRSRDPFCGWAATLVDSLDTLWIAGLKDEFDEAAKAAKDIDFTYTDRLQIPVFETTIRYLGGLLSAYDVSGGASGDYSFLLDKAVELADILMSIFDTANRMPILYYQWRSDYGEQPRRAGRVGLAELATLSMEFTRLAQLTGKANYYDAIDRITQGLVEMQERGTLMPGLFPESLDIGGCNATATNARKFNNKITKVQVEAVEDLSESEEYRHNDSGLRLSDDDRLERRDLSLADPEENEVAVETKKKSNKKPRGRAKSQVPLFAEDPDDECVPQGFVPGSWGSQKFHMGGGQDSAYEYFGKEYLLLGGRESKYQKLYEDTVDSVNKNLLFRPMVPGDWDIVFPAKVGLSESRNTKPDVEYEVTHLTCFIGGMYALGGKLFNREKDLKYAEKLTNACVWAYNSTATGIMPEFARVMSCPTFAPCEFNETLWRQELDPLYDWRDKQASDWEKSEAEREKVNGEDGLMNTESEKSAGKTDDFDTAPTEGKFTNKVATKQSFDALKTLEKRAVVPVYQDSEASSNEVTSVKGTSIASTSEKGLPDKGGQGTHQIGATKKAAVDEPTKSAVSEKKPTSRAKAVATSLTDDSAPPTTPPTTLKNQASRSPWSMKPLTHKEYVDQKLEEGFPRGYTSIGSTKYILRPEAIESVWYMYRVTGDSTWMEKGWAMFEATMRATRAPSANSAIADVLVNDGKGLLNEMESFWLAETLKYYYLLFSEPGVISLDEWVLNTEAHPFKL